MIIEQNIRLVVSDLDGTLLSASNELETSVLQTIESYRAQGGYFTIATGRPLVTAMPIVKKLKIDLPIILCNGAVIVQSGQVIEQYNFLLSSLTDLLSEAHHNGLAVLMFCQSHVYIFGHTSDTVVYEEKEVIACEKLSFDLGKWRELQAEKVILMGEFRLSQSLWEKQCSVTKSRFEAFQSEYNYLEIVDKKCNKGKAVAFVASKLGIRREQIMTIGNERNDLPMYAYSRIGAAVANSREELLQAADYICSKPYGQGVIEVMERFAMKEAFMSGKKNKGDDA